MQAYLLQAHLLQGAPTGPGRERLQIVLLDFGLAEELTPAVRTHFISFLNMIAKGEQGSRQQALGGPTCDVVRAWVAVRGSKAQAGRRAGIV